MPVETSVYPNVKCLYFLTVSHAVLPTITSPDPGQKLIVNQTDSVTFECSATGIPTPLIQWYQNDLLLNGTGPGINSRVDLTSIMNAPNGKLHISWSTLAINPIMGGDSGNYTCIASNQLIDNDEITEVRVQETIELFVQRAVLCQQLNYTIAISSSRCYLTSQQSEGNSF